MSIQHLDIGTELEYSILDTNNYASFVKDILILGHCLAVVRSNLIQFFARDPPYTLVKCFDCHAVIEYAQLLFDRQILCIKETGREPIFIDRSLNSATGKDLFKVTDLRKERRYTNIILEDGSLKVLFSDSETHFPEAFDQLARVPFPHRLLTRAHCHTYGRHSAGMVVLDQLFETQLLRIRIAPTRDGRCSADILGRFKLDDPFVSGFVALTTDSYAVYSRSLLLLHSWSDRGTTVTVGLGDRQILTAVKLRIDSLLLSDEDGRIYLAEGLLGPEPRAIYLGTFVPATKLVVLTKNIVVATSRTSNPVIFELQGSSIRLVGSFAHNFVPGINSLSNQIKAAFTAGGKDVICYGDSSCTTLSWTDNLAVEYADLSVPKKVIIRDVLKGDSFFVEDPINDTYFVLRGTNLIPLSPLYDKSRGEELLGVTDKCVVTSSGISSLDISSRLPRVGKMRPCSGFVPLDSYNEYCLLGSAKAIQLLRIKGMQKPTVVGTFFGECSPKIIKIVKCSSSGVVVLMHLPEERELKQLLFRLNGSVETTSQCLVPGNPMDVCRVSDELFAVTLESPFALLYSYETNLPIGAFHTGLPLLRISEIGNKMLVGYNPHISFLLRYESNTLEMSAISRAQNCSVPFHFVTDNAAYFVCANGVLKTTAIQEPQRHQIHIAEPLDKIVPVKAAHMDRLVFMARHTLGCLSLNGEGVSTATLDNLVGYCPISIPPCDANSLNVGIIACSRVQSAAAKILVNLLVWNEKEGWVIIDHDIIPDYFEEIIRAHKPFDCYALGRSMRYKILVSNKLSIQIEEEPYDEVDELFSDSDTVSSIIHEGPKPFEVTDFGGEVGPIKNMAVADTVLTLQGNKTLTMVWYRDKCAIESINTNALQIGGHEKIAGVFPMKDKTLLIVTDTGRRHLIAVA